jgi:hypothetical protein
MLLLQTWDLGLELFNITPELFWRDNTMRDTWLRYVAIDKSVFAPELTGEILVADKINDLFGDPVTLLDDAAFEAKVKSVAEAVAAMPVEKVLTWAEKLSAQADTAGVVIGDAPTGLGTGLTGLDSDLSITRTLRAPAINLGRIGVGTISLEAAKPMAAPIVTNIAGAQGDVGKISDLLIGAIIGTSIERGFNVALALADNLLSGSVCDNHIEGEVELKNGLANNGFDPGNSTLSNNSHPGLTSHGSLIFNGNRLERLWSRLPTGSINADGTWVMKSPGYTSLTLSGNELTGYGHSFVASMVTLQGNRFLCGTTTVQKPIGRLFTANIAITGNVSDFYNQLATLQVAANGMAATANLLVIDQV